MTVKAQDLNNNTPAVESARTTIDTPIDTVNLVLDGGLYYLNYIALAWSILYSLFFLIEFFEYRMFNSQGELATEQKGTQGLYKMIMLWWRYLLALLTYVIYLSYKDSIAAPLLGLIAILFYLAKFWADSIRIFEHLSYFSWSAKIADAVKMVLKK